MGFRDTAEYLALRAAMAGLHAVPYRLASAGLGTLARKSGRGRRLRAELVEEQLATIYPGLAVDECRALRRGVYQNLALTAAEFLRADPASLVGRVRVDPGWGALDEAVARGRGAIVATAHLGNFELGGRVLAARYPLLDVVKPLRNPAVDRLLTARRRSHGIATVPMARAGRAVLHHLRRGGVVALFVDQDAGGGGLQLDFLGRPASTWTGAARFALHTGCPVVPMAMVREASGHRLRIGAPVEPPAEPDTPSAVADYMGRISLAVEAYIHENPEQWFWVHRRWKGAASARSIPLPSQEKP